MTAGVVPSPARVVLSRGERRLLTGVLYWALGEEGPGGEQPSPRSDSTFGGDVLPGPGRSASPFSSWRPPLDARLWAALPALAEGHGVAALVAARLAPHGAEPVARQLEDAAARTLARGERMAADGARIGQALARAGIPFAWIKGLWLAPRLYDPPAARPLADLDLLVPPGAVQATTGVLTALGYVEDGRTWKHRRFIQPANRGVVDLRGEHPDNPRPVELHAWLGEAFRGIVLDLSGGLRLNLPATVLPPDLGFAHLAAHATVDALGRRARLIQWVDLARQAATFGAGDWSALVDLAATPHAARFVWPALALAARDLGAPVPGEVRAALDARITPRLRAWIAAADLDALSFTGRAGVPRPLGEIPAIWPRGAAEHVAVWRFIMLPGRWELADRYPRLAGSRLWPLVYARHAAYSAERLARRWRQRAGRR